MKDLIIASVILGASIISGLSGGIPTPSSLGKEVGAFTGSLDLAKRTPDPVVSRIFADNILLNLRYIKGDVGDVSYEPQKGRPRPVLWHKVREPFSFSFKLLPGEVFTFHDQILPEFAGKKIKSGWTQFSRVEGYKIFAGLWGNGVCHLATLINWVSSEAGLKVRAMVNHDFFPVFGIDREYGTAIVYIPGAHTTKMQNLYVENPYEVAVTFVFSADADNLTLRIEKEA